MNKRRIGDMLRQSGNYELSEPHKVLPSDSEAEICPSHGKRAQLMPSLQHLSDAPIDWGTVAQRTKTDIYDLLISRLKTCFNPDIFIRVGTRSFSCHLLLLQSYSSYFKPYRYGQMVKLSEDKVTPQAFSCIYEWMLQVNGGIENLLTRRNVLDIYRAAQFLGVTELEEQCWAFIDSPIFKEETALMLYLQARERGHTAVMDLMLPRVSKCFLPLVSLEDFSSLHLDVVCALLRSNYIAVHSEAEVFMTAVKWLMHGWQERRHHVLDLMHCVRFGLMDPWQLVDAGRNPLNPEFLRVITQNPDIRELMEDGLSYAVHKKQFSDNRDEYTGWGHNLIFTIPEQRNWIVGTAPLYQTYHEFLKSLEQYRGEYKQRGVWDSSQGDSYSSF